MIHVEFLLFLKVIYKIEKFCGVFKIPTLDILVMFAIQLCDNKNRQVTTNSLFLVEKKLVLSSFDTLKYSLLMLCKLFFCYYDINICNI